MPLKSRGYASYGTVEIGFDTDDFELTIGNYCSIAGGVTCFNKAHHRTTGVSSFPFFEVYGIGHPCGYSKGNVAIGNDVWIGDGVLITGGITIGNGAVVAARSVVTKNVPAFAVVGGNPAKVLKFRFDEETQTLLTASKWWDKTIEELAPHAHFLTSPNPTDVRMFIKALSTL
jgi:acetyltransferase-like isoleucine patch superfamily enzyme